MHQDPEHEDYDDDDYKHYPEYNDYGYPLNNKYNIDWAAWEQWLSKTIKDIVKEDNGFWKAPVNNQKNISDKYFMYIGNNMYDESLWKPKYFIADDIQIAYNNYLASNAAYILIQPTYYKSMFENLN